MHEGVGYSGLVHRRRELISLVFTLPMASHSITPVTVCLTSLITIIRPPTVVFPDILIAAFIT